MNKSADNPRIVNKVLYDEERQAMENWHEENMLAEESLKENAIMPYLRQYKCSYLAVLWAQCFIFSLRPCTKFRLYFS